MVELEKLEKELEEEKKVEKDEIEKRRKEIYEKVVKFTDAIRKKYGDLIKSVLIFGSYVRGDLKKTSDVDVWVILDDTTTKSTEDLDRIVASMHLLAREVGDIHIQTTPLTEFWSWIKKGSPELVNFLRYGLPIYDSGFVKPVQRMLEMGLLPPSEETVRLKAKAAEARLKKIKLDLSSMIFDLRYSVIDIIQAFIMYYYKEQPDAKAIPSSLEKLINEGKLDKDVLEKFKEIDKLWKDIDHKVIKEVKVEHLERALKIADDIVSKMYGMLPKHVVED